MMLHGPQKNYLIMYMQGRNVFKNYPNNPIKFLFQFNSASLAEQRSWGAQTDVFDVEAFIGLAEMPAEDFT